MLIKLKASTEVIYGIPMLRFFLCVFNWFLPILIDNQLIAYKIRKTRFPNEWMNEWIMLICKYLFWTLNTKRFDVILFLFSLYRNGGVVFSLRNLTIFALSKEFVSSILLHSTDFYLIGLFVAFVCMIKTKRLLTCSPSEFTPWPNEIEKKTTKRRKAIVFE